MAIGVTYLASNQKKSPTKISLPEENAIAYENTINQKETTPEEKIDLSNPQISLPRSGTIAETLFLNTSKDPVFWLNSGQEIVFNDSLTNFNKGVFRLITKEVFTNSTQAVYFNIDSVMTDSRQLPYDSVSLYSRYVNKNNSYYAGIRVDGTIQIKKKIRGRDFDLVTKRQVFEGIYSRYKNPNLIPINTWFGIMTRTTNLSDGSVKIELFLDRGNGNWDLAASVIDSNQPFLSGNGGILSDYLNVTFKDYFLK